jgi:hypothetical protein
MPRKNTNAEGGDLGVRQDSKLTTPATNSLTDAQTQAAKSWRDVLPVHPAAKIFPEMTLAQLRELGADIKANGLQSPIAVARCLEGRGSKYQLLDGRNRLNAMELAGVPFELAVSKTYCCFEDPDPVPDGHKEFPGIIEVTSDPYAYVLSANLHRRHLTAEGKRDVITALIKLHPDKSDRQIAEMLKVSPTTVGSVRKELEDTGMVSSLDTRTDKRGVQQPAHKPPRQTDPAVRAVTASNGVDQQASAEPKPSMGTRVSMAPHRERGLDLYETPTVAIRALLEVEPLVGPIWECACGPGNIVRELRAAGHHVITSDLIDYGCPDAAGGIDFLKQTTAPESATTILTNPPYRLANKFGRHALTLMPHVIMLLPLRFLEGLGRSDILDGGKFARVHVFRNRLPMIHRVGWTGPKVKTGNLAFAWFVWSADHHGPPTIHRITWHEEASTTTPPPAPAPPPDPGEMPDIPAFLDRRRAVP